MAYDLCIVGAGLVGSAIARNASSKPGMKVCLIGPQEPKCVTGQEIFGAHYDNGRITTSTDPDPVWAYLSKEAVKKYKDLEARAGMPFYSDVRSLWVGDEKTHGKLAGKDLEQLSSPDLMLKYPFLNFGEHDVGFLDRAGGVINPRAQVDASILIASKNGCDVIRDIVDHVSRTDHSGSHAMVLETENRKTVYAKHVILATNSFTGSRDLLAGARVKFEASPQTVVFAEVAKKDQKQLRDMPCVIYHGYGSPAWYTDYPRHPDGQIYFYMLPPIQYPDGIAFESFHSDACVTMVTPTGYPYIDQIHDNLGVAIGGNGTSERVCDEIGFIAANMMMSSSWNYEIPKEKFRKVFEEKRPKL